jgi:hypothetical protein
MTVSANNLISPSEPCCDRPLRVGIVPKDLKAQLVIEKQLIPPRFNVSRNYPCGWLLEVWKFEVET